MESATEKARFNMIEQQIRPWDVIDPRVLQTMMDLPRETFVPDAYRSLAYADIEVPIDDDQAMMAPKLVGRMLQALAVRPEDRVLEIGTGTGYVTACLARLGRQVTSIELYPGLLDEARDNLKELGAANVTLLSADAFAGPAAGAPFDVIAVTGSLPSADGLQGLQSQLNDGGRLFAVVGEAPVMEALLITRVAGGKLRRESLFETALPTLANVPQPEQFVF